MDYYDFVASAIAAVASLYNANAELAHLQKIGVKDVCVLWCGSTLQNNKEHDTMNTVTVYACPSVPMDSIECTIEYDPAVVEAFLHPPNSGQERADDGSFGDEKVL